MSTATADELCALLGIKKKTLQQWAWRGLVKRTGRGRYDVASVRDRVARASSGEAD